MVFILETYLSELASKDGSTGGGSTAGVIGSLSAALVQKVLNLQLGKKAYADQEKDLEEAITSLDSIQADYLHLIRQDTIAFEPLAKAYSLPKGTEAEKAARSQAIQEGLATAAKPAYDLLIVGQRLTEILAFSLDLKIKGSIVNDLLIAANYLEVASETAYLNLKINTDYLKDMAIKEKIEGQSDELIHQILNESRRIADAAYQYLESGSWE